MVAAVTAGAAAAGAAAVFMAGTAVATTVAADLWRRWVHGGGRFTVAGGLMAEEVTAEAAAFVADQRPVVMERAAVPTAGPKLAAILVGEIVRRMFVPQSPMASGIRSATRAVPRVPVKHAIPEAQRTQASPLVTAEAPMGHSFGSSRGESQSRRRSVQRYARLLVEVAMVGAAVALVGEAVGAGEVGVGASASDGRTGDLAGGSAGILGCTTPTGILRWLTTTRITATMDPTIRRTVRVGRQFVI